MDVGGHGVDMKVCICTHYNKYDVRTNGKGFFAERLSAELIKLGVEIVTPDVHADIDMSLGRWHYPVNADVKLIRLANAHVNSKAWYKEYNTRKWRCIKNCHGVIYQSEYGKRVCNAMIGKIKLPSVIIPNGIDPVFYSDIEPYKSKFKYNFSAVSRDWTPQKRLIGVIKSFRDAEIPDSCLFIAGNARGVKKKYGTFENVIFLDNVDQRTLGSIHKLCNAMIHMVYLDTCPNSVVEALVAGCPVICSNQGGTKEIVAPILPGLVIQTDPEYNYRVTNLDNPPKLNRQLLAEKIREVIANPPKFTTPEYLDIKNTAKAYLEFFKRMLK